MDVDSDTEFGDDEEILLEDIQADRRPFVGDKKPVFEFDDGDDDDDEEENEDASDLDMASDLEDNQDYLPDDRAWGQKRKTFYSTDADNDYTGPYSAEDAEIAELEEQEARNIQRRLMEQLSDADFSLGDITDNVQSESKTEVQPDLSSLSKRQKLDLFRKESPEFDSLVGDFEEKMTEVREKILPIIDLVKAGKLKPSSGVDFVKTKYRIILNYCTNIVFYILLKAKRIPVKDHPVLKALFRYRQLLQQMEPIDNEIISPQMEKILEVFKNSEGEEINKKKKLLKILKKRQKSAPAETEPADFIPLGDEKTEDEIHSDVSDEANDFGEEDGDKKRSITYEMAKNKGLTPKRSKEQRNPRVKHRNKFRKSLIRRRGQVRTPRAEIPVYGGEPTGIKIGLKKGRKIK